MEPNSTQQHRTSGTFSAGESEKEQPNERKSAATRDRGLSAAVGLLLLLLAVGLTSAIVAVVVLG